MKSLPVLISRNPSINIKTTKSIFIGSSRTTLSASREEIFSGFATLQTPRVRIFLLLEIIFLLIPSIFESSSKFLKHLFASLYCMIFCDFALPMPLSSKSSADDALFKSTREKRFEVISRSSTIYFKIMTSL